MKNHNKNFIELFSGTGGLSEGFLCKGWKPIAFVEKDTYCCQTTKTRLTFYDLKRKNDLNIYHNYLQGKMSQEHFWECGDSKELKRVINKEINSETTQDIISQINQLKQDKDIDLLLGGPPCQAYSLIGRRKPNDPRGELFKHYCEILEKIKPKTFIFENVKGLLSIDNGKLFQKIINLLKEKHYQVTHKILNSTDYGVVQNRDRLFILGCREQKVHISKNKEKNNFTANDILQDLTPLSPGQQSSQYLTKEINPYLRKYNIRNTHDILTLHQTRMHNTRDLEIYKMIIEKWNREKIRLKYSDIPSELRTHNNITSFLDRYKVVAANLPCHTIVAHIAKDGHYYIHPDIKQCRSLSIREAARIQSFPDNFFFEGPRTAKFTQIGNAVPPLVSKFLEKQISQLLRKTTCVQAI